jgi:hypothetical protein
MFTDPLEFDLKLTGLDANTDSVGVRLASAEPNDGSFLDFFEFTGSKWETVGAPGSQYLSSFVLPYLGPVESGSATVRIALTGDSDFAPSGPAVGSDPYHFKVTADLVNLDKSGKPIGEPIASAAHDVTADLLDIKPDWPTTLEVGKPSVFRMDYVDPTDATFQQPIAGSAGSPDLSIGSPEIYFRAINQKSPKLDVAWSDSKTGPWHAIGTPIPGDENGIEYFLPKRGIAAHSSTTIWLRVTYHAPAGATKLQARAGWIRVSDIIGSGLAHDYSSSVVDNSPTLPVTGSGPVGLIVIAGAGLLLVGALVRVVGRRRRRVAA